MLRLTGLRRLNNQRENEMNFTHQANPVKVNARQIFAVHFQDPDGLYPVSMMDGQPAEPMTEAMVARYFPSAGDYIVTQEDGYVYVNPREVFERKYSLIAEGEQQ